MQRVIDDLLRKKRRRVQRHIDKTMDGLLLPLGFQRRAAKSYCCRFDAFVLVLELDTHKWGDAYNINMGVTFYDGPESLGVWIPNCTFVSHLGECVRGLPQGARSFPSIEEEVDCLTKNDVTGCATELMALGRKLNDKRYLFRIAPPKKLVDWFLRFPEDDDSAMRFSVKWPMPHPLDLAILGTKCAVLWKRKGLAKAYWKQGQRMITELAGSDPGTTGQRAWLQKRFESLRRLGPEAA